MFNAGQRYAIWFNLYPVSKSTANGVICDPCPQNTLEYKLHCVDVVTPCRNMPAGRWVASDVGSAGIHKTKYPRRLGPCPVESQVP